MALEDGYYWVKLSNYDFWEPALYETRYKTFRLIGRAELYQDYHLEIGEKIQEKIQ